MADDPARYYLSEGRSPRNALPGFWWSISLFFTVLTWALAGASIGVTAASIQRFKNLRNSVKDVFSPAEVELSAHDLFPAGVIILILCSVIFILAAWLAVHFVVHRPGTTKPAHRGFHGVPSFYWTLSLVLLVLVIFTFVDILVYTHYFRTGNLIIKAYLPDGVVVADLELDDIYNRTIALLPHGLAYVNYSFFLLVAILPWTMVFSGLLTVFMLWSGADEAIEAPLMLEEGNPAAAPSTDTEPKPRESAAPEVVEEARDSAVDASSTADPTEAASQPDVDTEAPAGVDEDTEADGEGDDDEGRAKVDESAASAGPEEGPAQTDEDTPVIVPTKDS